MQFTNAFVHQTHTHSYLTNNDYDKQTTTIIGNGKVKTKEPLEMANKAIAQLQEIVEIASKLE